MSYFVIDAVYSALQAQTLGSPMLFIIGAIAVLLLVAFKAGIPPFFAAILILPALIGFAFIGLPKAVLGVALFLGGLVLAAVFIRIFINYSW